MKISDKVYNKDKKRSLDLWFLVEGKSVII